MANDIQVTPLVMRQHVMVAELEDASYGFRWWTEPMPQRKLNEYLSKEHVREGNYLSDYWKFLRVHKSTSPLSPLTSSGNWKFLRVHKSTPITTRIFRNSYAFLITCVRLLRVFHLSFPLLFIHKATAKYPAIIPQP